MNTLSYSDLASIVFIGQSTLNQFYPDIIRKFPEYNVMPSVAGKDIPTLEIPLEKALLICCFNGENECYTCWIKLDNQVPENVYLDFCDKTFCKEPDNFWTSNERPIEFLKEDSNFYFILT